MLGCRRLYNKIIFVKSYLGTGGDLPHPLPRWLFINNPKTVAIHMRHSLHVCYSQLATVSK